MASPKPLALQTVDDLQITGSPTSIPSPSAPQAASPITSAPAADGPVAAVAADKKSQRIMFDLAAEGDAAALSAFLAKGIDPNTCDYDRRCSRLLYFQPAF